MLKQTQLNFWSVNLGKASEYNPVKETEFLVLQNICRNEI